MSIKMTKGRFILFLIALCLTTFIVMNDYVIIPAVADMYEAFPENEGAVNFILSGPQIFGVFAALICGKITKISKKAIICVAFGVFALCGIFGVAILTPAYISVVRAIMGTCMGFVNTAAVALLAEVFVNEKLRSTYMGIFNAVMSGIGAVMSYIAGILALQSWTMVFRVYWASVPLLLLFVFFLPGKTASSAEAKTKTTAVKEKIGAKYWIFIVSLFVFVLTYMVISYMVSVYIAEHNLGDSALAGTCTALSTFGSCVTSLIFGFSYSKLKRWVIVPSWVIFVLCYFVMLLFPSKAVVVISTALMGAAFGNGFSYYYMDGTLLVPESQVDFSMGVITAVQGLAMGMASFFATALMNLLGTTNITPTFAILGCIAIAGTVFGICMAVNKKA